MMMVASRCLCPAAGGDEASRPTQSLIASCTGKASALDGTTQRTTRGSPASFRCQVSCEKLKTTLQGVALVGTGST